MYSEEWEKIAVYYADVIAATAYNYANKSSANSEKKRQLSICVGLAEHLELGELFNKRPSNKEDVIKRLKEVADELRKYIKK